MRRFVQSQAEDAGDEDDVPGSLNSDVPVMMLEPAATEDGESDGSIKGKKAVKSINKREDKKKRQ